MEFDCNPIKAATNLKKRRVRFEKTASVYGDPMAHTFADPDHSIGEERRLMFESSRMARVLAVIYTHKREKYRPPLL